MSASKSKTFIYKLATFNKPVLKQTLQSLLASALTLHPKVKDRHENPDADGVAFRLINYTGSRGRDGGAGAMLGCEFFSFSKGADKETIDVGLDAEHFDVDAIPAGTNKEFLEGAVYFGVLENHVVVIQSKALDTHDLERHLNWFLRDKTELMDGENQVSLEDNTPPAAQEFKDAKGLELSAPVEFKPMEVSKRESRGAGAAPSVAEDVPAESNESVRVVPKGRAWEALKSFLGQGFNFPSELDAEDMVKTGHLQVKLSLSWQNKPQQDAPDFLRNIAHNLRHVPADQLDYGVVTSTGRIGKEQFKLQQLKGVRWGKARPEFDDLFPKMLAWLDYLHEHGKITI